MQVWLRVDNTVTFYYILLMENEIWLPAFGCDGYFVSSLGNFKSVKRNRVTEIHPFVQNRGYCQVGITRNGKKTNKTLHSIVAETFIGPRNGMEVNHKDGDKLNNSVNNLEYVTRSANMKHAFASGLHAPKNRKLTKENVEFIRSDKIASGRPESYYAELFGVNKSNINHIMRRRNWK